MKKLVWVLVSIIIISACKKDNTKTNNNMQGMQANIHPTYSTSFYGVLTFQKLQTQIIDSTTINTNHEAYAYFDSTAHTFLNFTHYVNVDSVMVNNMLTMASNSTYSYMNFSDTFCVWHILGANGIPTFTYTNNSKMPICKIYNTWPDSVYHTQALTLPIQIRGVDSVTIQILFSSGGTITKKLNAYNITSVTFSATELSAVSGRAYLNILANNRDIESVYGKAMCFQYTYNYQKGMYFK